MIRNKEVSLIQLFSNSFWVETQQQQRSISNKINMIDSVFGIFGPLPLTCFSFSLAHWLTWFACLFTHSRYILDSTTHKTLLEFHFIFFFVSFLLYTIVRFTVPTFNFIYSRRFSSFHIRHYPHQFSSHKCVRMSGTEKCQ